MTPHLTLSVPIPPHTFFFFLLERFSLSLSGGTFFTELLQKQSSMKCRVNLKVFQL